MVRGLKSFSMVLAACYFYVGKLETANILTNGKLAKNEEE